MTSLVKRGLLAAVAGLFLLGLIASAQAEEAWKAEFEQTCSKTSQTMTLSPDELKKLVDKCDALQQVIETQEASVRKVYLKRLQLCRNLYSYMLDYKKEAQNAK
ncbi:MAG TPA: hypothetical protein DCZ75_10205 [Geobacter sp.]|nr:hypothetical protein [Geobacter sp.]